METQTESRIKKLFDIGAHFGFSKSRRHPTVAPYLYTTKQGTDIFDLEKTNVLIDEAAAFVKKLGEEDKQVLFVGTKEEAAAITQKYAEKLSMPYVTHRWIGGMLTNFSELSKRVKRLVNLRTQSESGELESKYTKRERLELSREMEKLGANFGGIVIMEKLPAALIVVDPRHESIAVKEANNLNIPVVAVMGSDCNVDVVSKPVIVNDAHTASVSFALSELASAYEEGKNARPAKAAEETQKKAEK